MKNIVLTGFMASGKTVVGKKLAEIIGFDFVDMDDYIEKKTGMTIGKIFKEYGEEYFRELESRTAEELSDRVNTVIACGGGTVLKKGNIDALRKKGIIINLEPTQEVIKQRLESAANGRPLLDVYKRQGIGCISDDHPQPIILNSKIGTIAVVTVGRINNKSELTRRLISGNNAYFTEMSGGDINDTELVASLICQRDNVPDGIKYAQSLIEGSMTMIISADGGLYADVYKRQQDGCLS